MAFPKLMGDATEVQVSHRLLPTCKYIWLAPSQSVMLRTRQEAVKLFDNFRILQDIPLSTGPLSQWRQSEMRIKPSEPTGTHTNTQREQLHQGYQGLGQTPSLKRQTSK